MKSESVEEEEVKIEEIKEPRKITMKDLPKDHYMPEEAENLDDCPYIKRFYKWAQEHDNEPQTL